jgi:Protein of unknown function (DUF4019)
LSSPPASDLGNPAPAKRVLWKWSAAVTGIILLFLMWQCGLALVQGRKLSDAAVRHFHEQLNSQKYDEIYREADDGFKAGQSHDELIMFLQAVHKKLGDARDEKQVSIRADTNTHGRFITAWYRTAFTSGSAVETFIWVESSGTLKLYGYHIQSNALILKEQKQ